MQALPVAATGGGGGGGGGGTVVSGAVGGAVAAVVGAGSPGGRAGATVVAAGAVVAVETAAGTVVVDVEPVVDARASSCWAADAAAAPLAEPDTDGSSEPQAAATPARPTRMAIARNRT
jgi:type IV secretion system protein TrbL